MFIPMGIQYDLIWKVKINKLFNAKMYNPKCIISNDPLENKHL